MTTDEALQRWGDYDRDNPFPLFARVRDTGSVHRVRLADGHAAWLIIGYAEARAALNDPRFSKDMHAAFASGAAIVAEGLPGTEFARHMLSVDPPDHTRLRTLVSSAFYPRRVEALRPRVQSIVGELLDGLAARGPDAAVDLVAEFAFALPFTVICELLGVDTSQRERLGRALSGLLVPTPTPTAYARAKVASDEVVAMLGALVVEKQAHPDDGLVSGLIRARDGDDALTTQELLSTIFQVIVAGHDTTTSLLGNAIVALLQHRDQLARLRADPSRMTRAVEEFLRYDAPVPHSTFRYAIEPVDIGGVKIPENAQVIISLAGANRDPARFDDAERLGVDRPPQPHLAFGHGIHFCLGAGLARMEGAIALTSLVTRFPEMRLAVPDADLHWGHGDGLVLRGLSELPVVLGPEATRR